MRLEDLTDKKDPLFDMLSSMGEDEERSRHKKKKKKKKSKKIKAKWLGVDEAPSAEDLASMSKGDLRDYIVKKGIRINPVDLESKKRMREAIKAHYGIIPMDTGSRTTVALSEPVVTTQVISKERPPYYHDEDTGDFVIPHAQDTDAMNCYNAMSALGEIRKRKRPDDDFSALMDNLTRRIVEEARRPKLDSGNVIEAEFEVLPAEEPKALPPAKEKKSK